MALKTTFRSIIRVVGAMAAVLVFLVGISFLLGPRRTGVHWRGTSQGSVSSECIQRSLGKVEGVSGVHHFESEPGTGFSLVKGFEEVPGSELVGFTVGDCGGVLSWVVSTSGEFNLGASVDAPGREETDDEVEAFLLVYEHTQHECGSLPDRTALTRSVL